MNRIALILALAAPIIGLGLATEATASEKMNVVYHLSDSNKVNFVLGNIRNHLKGVGGPQNVHIVLVVHGPALQAFHDIEALDAVRKKVEALQTSGVEFDACGNTMRAQKVSIKDLLSDFIQVNQGGVVRIAELQAQGYIYIRP